MKKWNIISDYDPKLKIFEQILNIRGITETHDREKFLNPGSVDEIIQEFSGEFKDSLKRAKDLILKAVKENQKIIIYGDYDSDGICSTAILYICIKNEIGYANIDYFIPNRFNHGYGLSKGGVDEVLAKFDDADKTLFITVDTGITAVEEIKYVKSLGHQIIITDHHQKPESLPDADAIVWSDSVVGSGVSLLLAKELGSENPHSVALAAIATVTDLQKIVGVNRVIVKKGLEILNSNPPLGIKKLIEAAGKAGSELTTYDLGWVIGPRLNASGRLEEATMSLELVLAEDEIKAEELAKKLNDVNTERQLKTVEMYEYATLEKSSDLPKIIVASSESFHEGIIGLVAAKLVQKYYRPSIVISLTDGEGKGSVRSVKGVNIIEMLREVDDLFTSLGGHPMAAGFTIEKENIPVLEEKIIALAEQHISAEMLIPELTIDIKLPVDIIGTELLKELDLLKPFGMGNEEPIFLCEDLGVTDVSWIGRDTNHLRLRVMKNGNYLKAVFFNADKSTDLGLGDKVDLAFNLRKNEYNGKVYTDLIVKDLKIHQNEL